MFYIVSTLVGFLGLFAFIDALKEHNQILAAMPLEDQKLYWSGKLDHYILQDTWDTMIAFGIMTLFLLPLIWLLVCGIHNICENRRLAKRQSEQ